jgi:hypothetical protein
VDVDNGDMNATKNTENGNMDTAKKMTALLSATGKDIKVEDQTRTIKSVRLTYGRSVVMILDKPLNGRTSRLLTISETDCHTVELITNGSYEGNLTIAELAVCHFLTRSDS